MKKIGFILIMALFATVVSAQKADSLKIHKDSIPAYDPGYQLVLSSPIDPRSGLFTSQNLYIEGDTVKAVLDLLKSVQEKSEMLYAAENVLRYVSADGKVADLKGFQSAVNIYRRTVSAYTQKTKNIPPKRK